jgi:hypothetical protein
MAHRGRQSGGSCARRLPCALQSPPASACLALPTGQLLLCGAVPLSEEPSAALCHDCKQGAGAIKAGSATELVHRRVLQLRRAAAGPADCPPGSWVEAELGANLSNLAEQVSSAAGASPNTDTVTAAVAVELERHEQCCRVSLLSLLHLKHVFRAQMYSQRAHTDAPRLSLVQLRSPEVAIDRCSEHRAALPCEHRVTMGSAHCAARGQAPDYCLCQTSKQVAQTRLR